MEPANEASQRVLRAAGFEREGVLGSYLDFGSRRADAVVFARVASGRAGARGHVRGAQARSNG